MEEARKKIEEGEEELEKNERNFYSQIQKAEGLLREEEKKLNKAEGEYERNLALFNEKMVKAMEEFQRAEGEILQAGREIADREAELNSLKEGLSLIKDEEERAKTQALIQYMEAEINKGKKGAGGCKK